ncbi:MAG: ABC transporter ATP-binding protein/permease [Bacteroidota bacterium]|nr:ABC transporter ATP-binding protein/permease [Bacteroidota bacterium]
MIDLVKEILEIIRRSGSRLKPGLIFIIVSGTILESLSIGLVVPAVLLLSKGNTAYIKPLFLVFTAVTGLQTYWAFLICALSVIVLFYLFKTLFIAFVNTRQNKFIFRLEVTISDKLLKTYLERPYAYHLHKNSAQLTKNIYYDVKQLCNTVNQALNLFSEGLVSALLILLLVYFQPGATLSAIALLGLVGFTFIRAVRKKLTRWAADRQKRDGERIKVLSNTLTNVKDIKLYGRYAEFYKANDEKSVPGAYATMKHANLQKLPTVWLEFIAVFSLIILIGVMIFRGNTLVSIIPMLTLFAAAMFRILPSMNRISSAYQIIKLYMPVIHSVHDELNMSTGISDQNNAVKHPLIFESKIELKNISFGYVSSQAPLFTGLSLTINKGSYVGLIGQSGAGKSTLIDIVIGLLTPQAGSVEIDGQNIDHNLRSWQDQIGYVAQTINLMDDTIGNNIAFGIAKDDIDMQLLQQAIADAQLDDFINNLPDGLETMVGERGVRLSGGQRQRIGIARALYNNPSVLVLDEATNSLDPKTEAEIMKSIKLLKAKKTILFVTHKNALLKDCDVVYEMKNRTLVSASMDFGLMHE